MHPNINRKEGRRAKGTGTEKPQLRTENKRQNARGPGRGIWCERSVRFDQPRSWRRNQVGGSAKTRGEETLQKTEKSEKNEKRRKESIIEGEVFVSLTSEILEGRKDRMVQRGDLP